MSPNDVLTIAGEVVLLGAAVFIMYRALALRKVLIDRPYRTRALWTAIGALSVVSFLAAAYLDSVFGENPTTLTGLAVEATIWGFTFLALYGWIASNVNVALEADYFHRDALSWRKGGGVAALVVIFLTYVVVNLPPQWFTQAEANSISVLSGPVFAGVALYATAALVITYRRIADRRIKTYTLWVVLSVLFVLLLILIPPPFSIIPVFLWVYTMFHSVSSLTIRTHSLS